MANPNDHTNPQGCTVRLCLLLSVGYRENEEDKNKGE